MSNSFKHLSVEERNDIQAGLKHRLKLDSSVQMVVAQGTLGFSITAVYFRYAGRWALSAT